MANNSHLILIGFCVIFLFHGCFAQLERSQERFWQELEEQQQHRLRAKTQCNIQRLNAQKPKIKFQSEAGVSEFWDSNNPEFECAGVEVERRGIHGTVIPGCAETFESQGSYWGQGQPGQGQGQQGQGQGRRYTDRHQKLRRFQQGDILALPAGFTHWTFNDGDVPLVTVALIDVANEVNQLDLEYKRFFLAGNPQGQGQGQWGGQGEKGQGQEQWGGQGQKGQEGQGQGQWGGQGEKGQGQEQWGGQGQKGQEGKQWGGQGQGGQQQLQQKNIFNGFDDQLMADALKTDPQTIQKLKGQQDQRGFIVRAEQLQQQLSLPEFDEQEQQRQQQQQQQQQYGGGKVWRPNGLEETVCTVELRENIGHPTRADVYNPRAGRISTSNSQTLPILGWLKLSAETGFLYSNAILAPHWNVNAHSAIYVIRGNARIQVVGHSGNPVFDEEVSEGQLIIVPQNFAVIKKAGNEGFEYVAFKTNDNAITSPLAGRLSAIRSIPEEVLMSSYQISREEAMNLKFGRQEAKLFSGQPSQGRRESA
ncbi:hypothetical protein ACH5RR_031529 [Cinchona calisaya]|uniref:Cupin type-1 domain-containing protein n=1 Tax=Cinchona calisaya TaxID=153742 RepID=A0ABD2YJY2_9GENT